MTTLFNDTLFNSDTTFRNRPQLDAATRAELDRIRKDYPDERICAVAFDRDSGTFVDAIFGWQTAESMAGEYAILAIDHDGTFMPREKIQSICDREVDLYDDCFDHHPTYC